MPHSGRWRVQRGIAANRGMVGVHRQQVAGWDEGPRALSGPQESSAGSKVIDRPRLYLNVNSHRQTPSSVSALVAAAVTRWPARHGNVIEPRMNTDSHGWGRFTPLHAACRPPLLFLDVRMCGPTPCFPLLPATPCFPGCAARPLPSRPLPSPGVSWKTGSKEDWTRRCRPPSRPGHPLCRGA